MTTCWPGSTIGAVVVPMTAPRVSARLGGLMGVTTALVLPVSPVIRWLREAAASTPSGEANGGEPGGGADAKTSALPPYVRPPSGGREQQQSKQQ